eukprot:12245770-Karenia_brevis.AAC.1
MVKRGRAACCKDLAALKDMLQPIFTSPTSCSYTKDKGMGKVQQDVLLSDEYQKCFVKAKKVGYTWALRSICK